MTQDSVAAFFSDLEPFFYGRSLTYVDVGAFEGEVLTKLIESSLKVGEAHLFEPNPDSFAVLEGRAKAIFKGRRLELHDVAVGAARGVVKLQKARSMTRVAYESKSESDDSNPFDSPSTERPVVTLDEMLGIVTERRISLLKIDVEGFELEVLRGAQRLLSEQAADVIYIEAGMNPGSEQHTYFGDIDAALTVHGYRLFRVYEQQHEWLDDSPFLRRVNAAYFSRRFGESNPYRVTQELFRVRAEVTQARAALLASEQQISEFTRQFEIQQMNSAELSQQLNAQRQRASAADIALDQSRQLAEELAQQLDFQKHRAVTSDTKLDQAQRLTADLSRQVDSQKLRTAQVELAAKVEKSVAAATIASLKLKQHQLIDLGHALMKQAVRADQLLRQSDQHRQQIQQQLAYRLGSVLVTCRRQPLKLLVLPWMLIREGLNHRRERQQRRTADAAGVGVWQHLGARLAWRSQSLLAKAAPQWLSIDVAPEVASLGLRLRLQTPEGGTDDGALLLLECADASGTSLAVRDPGFDRTPAVDGRFQRLLAVGVDILHDLQIVLPEGCRSARITVVRHRARHVFRVVFEQITRSTQLPQIPSPPTAPNADTRLSESAAQLPQSGRLRALSLLDPFSEHCFAPEFDLVPLRRSGWSDQVTSGTWDLLFAESAWRGNGGTWNYCMTKFSGAQGDDLRGVLALCRARGIPTVFWNKEDPANFDIFIDVARQFDHVFTTDANCVQRYRAQLGHDRVHVLPFAAQSSMHHPILETSRNARVAFAGSWNGAKYPARARWLDILLGAPMSRGILDIFDRYADATDAAQRFPERYGAAVRGAVPYEVIADQVYRRYGVMINVNSVEESPSMVARRVFELAASGTPLISSPSPALEGPFAQVVDVVTTADQMARTLNELLSDELAALRRSAHGVRLVHSKHTYRHRAAEVAKVLGLHVTSALQPETVTAICVSKRPQFLAHVASMMNAQTHPHVQLIFVAHGEGFDLDEVRAAFDPRLKPIVLHLPGQDSVLADGLNLAIDRSTTPLLAKIDDDDHYGPDYLADAALAFSYSDAGLVGKGSYFCFVERTNQMALRFPSKHYRYTKLVHGGTLVWDRRRTGEQRFERVRQGTDTAFLRALQERAVPILSTDPFNFVHMRYADSTQHTWHIDDDEFLRKARILQNGLNLDLAYT